MSREVFEKAMSLAHDYQWGMTLGGGEPTLHPNLLKWVMDASLNCLDASMDMGSPAVLVVTNGKKKDVALKLAKLGHLGVIQAELSQDMWHDRIDPEVIREFTRFPASRYGDKKVGHSGIRNVEGGVKGMGRALTNGLQDVDGCGCQTKKLGNILDLAEGLPKQLLDFPGECQSYVDKHEMVNV